MNEQFHSPETNWQIDYESVDPIRIRDPVAEALAVLDPGDPFVISYRDVVKQAGHSCPTASGAFRLTQLGLAELYPTEIPVRSEIEVTMGGSKSDSAYGVLSRIISYITGATTTDGFGGLAGGHGDRQNLLHFGDFDVVDPTVAFERRDSGESVTVTYHIGDVPEAGPAIRYLSSILDGTATPDERTQFADAWHSRVQTVLQDDSLFTVSPGDT